MESFKKALRLIILILLIVLASVGIGMSGGVPLPNQSVRRDKEEAETELVEEHQNQDVKGEVG